MSCSHCSAKVEPYYSYCSQCGMSLNLNSNTSPNTEDSVANKSNQPSTMILKKKPMPFWFKLLIALAVLALIGVTGGILFTESLVDVVDNQLQALRQNDIEKAYEAYNSKAFKTSTSLEQFGDFVKAYPVFHNNQSAHFTKRSIDSERATLKGQLTSNDHINTPIEYQLIREEGKWKILNIRFLKPETVQNAADNSHKEGLIEIVKAQLKDIQNQKFKEAYQLFSSKEFKETTSEKAFQEFVERYPILMRHQKVSFHKPAIRNGIGTLSAILQSEQLAAYVKYYLMYEDQSWKIWSMRILSPSEQQLEKNDDSVKLPFHEFDPSHSNMSFGRITLSDQIDSQGQIVHPRTSFTTNLKDLYVDIEIENGLKGNIIYLSLQHLETGSSIPAKAMIEENGDSLLMSIFSPPTSGWPKGHYKLIVTTSSGLNSLIDLIIE